MRLLAIIISLLCLTSALLHAENGRWLGKWTVAPPPAEGEETVAPPAIDLPTPGDAWLIDPTGVLPPAVRREQEDFLRAHADESKIGLHLYVFPGDAIPGNTTALEQAFSNKQAAVVCYFFGEPQRASVYFSQPLADVVGDAGQRRALQSSIMQALEVADPAEQLEAFLSQMSVRLYWMEDTLENVLPAAPPNAIKPPEPRTAKDFPMALPTRQDPWWFAGAAAVVLLPVAFWIYRRRMRYPLPVYEIEPRLGGDHAAGVGGVISFLNAETPPAAQRDQMPGNPPRI